MENRPAVNFSYKLKNVPEINSGEIITQHEDVVIMEFDLKIKYCDFSSWYNDNEKGLELYIISPENVSNDDDCLTVIILPDFKGWDVYLGEIIKSTMRLVLIKK